MSFSSDLITIEKTGAVGTVWLDRPEKYNALSEEFWLALPQALAALEGDESIRAIVLAGKGLSLITN